jgi:hypothetical protein
MIVKVTFSISGNGQNGMGCVPEPGKFDTDPITWAIGLEYFSASEALVCWDPFQDGSLYWKPKGD